MLALLIAATLAHAGGIHAGVPVKGIKGFGAPSYQTSQSGWSAVVLDGFVRVYVGKTEADAEAWVGRMVKILRREKPKKNAGAFSAAGISDVYGNGTKLILFRDGNIGICVQHKKNARPWAAKAHAAIVDEGPAWPQPPRLTSVAETWRIEADADAVHVAFEGGKLVPGQGLTFSVPPTAAVAWDTLGRATRVQFKPPEATP